MCLSFAMSSYLVRVMHFLSLSQTCFSSQDHMSAAQKWTKMSPLATNSFPRQSLSSGSCSDLCVSRSMFSRSVLSRRFCPLPAVSTGIIPARGGTHLLLPVWREPGHQAQRCGHFSGVRDQRWGSHLSYYNLSMETTLSPKLICIERINQINRNVCGCQAKSYCGDGIIL